MAAPNLLPPAVGTAATSTGALISAGAARWALAAAVPALFSRTEASALVKGDVRLPDTVGTRMRRVLVRAPQAADAALWRAYGWRGEPDPGEAAAEHEAFRALLAESGAEVVLAETPHGPDPDAIYVYDPAIVADSGAILLRPGKEGRRGEPAAFQRQLA